MRPNFGYRSVVSIALRKGAAKHSVLRRLAVASIALTALGTAGIALTSVASAQFLRREVPPPVDYYRFKAKYVVKESGEVVQFDLVRPCTASYARDLNGDSVGLRPGGGGKIDMDSFFGGFVTMFPKVTRDGRAIIVKIPMVCDGKTTANGGIPSDFLPAVRWYNDADDLSFGWMYASEDAYRSPRAKISFEGASIEAATSTDFRAWQKQARQEFRPSKTIRHPFGLTPRDIRWGGVTIARICYGVRRLELPPEIRELAARAQPSSEIHFWDLPWEGAPEKVQAGKRLFEEVTYPNALKHKFSGRDWGAYHSTYPPISVPTEASGAPDYPRLRTGDIYPFSHSPYGIVSFKKDRAEHKPLYFDLDTTPEAKGFLVCSSEDIGIDVRRAEVPDIDHQTVSLFVNGKPSGGVSAPNPRAPMSPWFFFEDSNFFYDRAID